MADQEALDWIKKYHRLTNYLGASMLYLKDNFLLEEELTSDHIKSRILGHWGTVPGLNLVYAGVNYLVNKTNQKTMVIAGPGHGAPAVLANLFVEGTLEEYYPKATRNREGIAYLTKQFSWPGGFPSHTYPGVPGTIMEGGELGYSLGTAFGTVLDNPDLLTVCIVGDGEAETGPLAASWQSNKFINPETSGTVLPILHLNGYRISGPTIFGTMSNDEIYSYFKGLGYHPHILDQYTSSDIYNDFLNTIDYAHKQIIDIKENWKNTKGKPIWPMIVLRTMKGWTSPDFVDGRKIEDHNNSHGIPLEHPKSNEVELAGLLEWLKSYNVNELLNDDKSIKEDVLKFLPQKDMLIGKVKEAYGGELRVDLNLPELTDISMEVDVRGIEPESAMEHMGQYFAKLFESNDLNFRLFSPDETESNKLGKVFDVTERKYLWPVREFDEHISHDGKVMEILSEHVLQEWMQGYVLTGRHGILVSYEAFLGIITTMIDQFIKYLKTSQDIAWRKPLPSLNYVATSTGWRQDHNGFSHQNPSLINTLLTKQADFVSIYFPADVNTLLVSLEDCLNRVDNVNLIVSGKRELPQWLSMDEAREHVERGISVWEWAGNKHGESVDVVLASCGDYQTQETIAAAQMLKEDIPELSFQYVNVNELTRLGLGDEHSPIMSTKDYTNYFTNDKDVVFNFHGYPEAIKQLTWGRRISEQLILLGYIEEGTTTTPFDMQVLNKASRYHVCIQAILSAARFNPAVKAREEELVRKYSEILDKHSKYIVEHGDDLPEVKNFKFKFA